LIASAEFSAVPCIALHELAQACTRLHSPSGQEPATLALADTALPTAFGDPMPIAC
jgi:hypothetical protein